MNFKHVESFRPLRFNFPRLCFLLAEDFSRNSDLRAGKGNSIHRVPKWLPFHPLVLRMRWAEGNNSERAGPWKKSSPGLLSFIFSWILSFLRSLKNQKGPLTSYPFFVAASPSFPAYTEKFALAGLNAEMRMRGLYRGSFICFFYFRSSLLFFSNANLSLQM